MEKLRSILRRFGDFVSGRGFTAMALLCTAIIGVAAWIYVASTRTPTDAASSGNLEPSLHAEDSVGKSGGVSSLPVTLNPASGGTETQAPSAAGEKEPAQTLPVEEPEPEPAVPVSLGVESIRFTWPLDGAIVTTYAMDCLLYDVTMRDWRTHDGLDMACPQGTRVMAAADGTVTEVRDEYLLGTTVVIDHGNGVSTSYSNLESVPTVSPGDWVWAGYVIGSVGDTARGESAMVSHLHVAMTIDGQSVDPEDFFPN